MLDLHPGVEPARKEVAPRFDKFADEFMRTYARANNKPSEICGKRSILRVHLKPAFGHMRLDMIGVRHIEAMKARLLDQGLQRKTVNNILAVLSKLLVHAVELEVLEKKPRIRLLKIPPQKFDFLDFDEYSQLLEVLDTEPLWGSALMTAAEAGLRVGEILALHQDDINHRARVITVRRSVWNGIVGSPKGGRQRQVPMTRRLAEILRREKHLKGELVWCRPDGGMLTVNMAEYAIQRVCQRAGLRKIGWHVLRHSFCSALAARGAAPKAIQELAGHSSMATTMRYMHLAPTALVEAIDLLNDEPRGGNSRHSHGTILAPHDLPDQNIVES